MDDAFKDLHGLMTLAQEMVTLAERFRVSLAEKGRQAGDPGEEAGEAAMAAELASLGIASPVTKDMAGAQFHQQLSRQVRACCTCFACSWCEFLDLFHNLLIAPTLLLRASGG